MNRQGTGVHVSKVVSTLQKRSDLTKISVLCKVEDWELAFLGFNNSLSDTERKQADVKTLLLLSSD